MLCDYYFNLVNTHSCWDQTILPVLTGAHTGNRNPLYFFPLVFYAIPEKNKVINTITWFQVQLLVGHVVVPTRPGHAVAEIELLAGTTQGGDKRRTAVDPA